MRKLITITITADAKHLGAGGAQYMMPKELIVSDDVILAVSPTSKANFWDVTLKPEYVAAIKQAVGIDQRLNLASITVVKKFIADLL